MANKKRNLDFDINSEAFENLRFDFNMVLRDLIKNMMENGDEEGVISAKVKIKIVDLRDEINGFIKEPQIEFKTESNISRKISTESDMPGQLQMMYDEADKRWKMVDRIVGQMAMEDL